MRISWASTRESINIAASAYSGLHKRLSRAALFGVRPNIGSHKKMYKNDNISRRKRSGMTLAKEKSIQMAKRKDQVKKQGAEKKDRMQGVDWAFVYVGNIESSVNEDSLRAMFSSCGTITRIQFRCSRGQAVTIGMPIALNIRSSRDRQYATVEFKERSSVRKALQVNGKWLDGSQLVVCISPADLPEVNDIVHARLGELEEREGRPNPYKVESNGFRPMAYQPTEQLIAESSRAPTRKADRHHIFGFSFAKCVA